MTFEIEENLDLDINHPFSTLKQAFKINSELRKEVETAFKTITDKHNPSDRAERFTYGGACEWVMAVAAWVAGIRTFPGGHSQNGFDLIEYRNGLQGLWSIKSSSQDKARGDIHLRNNVSSSSENVHIAKYAHPTVFVGAFLPGIVYLDPKLAVNLSAKFKYDKDAVKLKAADLLEYANKNPNLVIPFNAPKNSGAPTEDGNLKIVANILSSGTYPVLAVPMKNLQEISERVKLLRSMNSEGKISDSQYEENLRQIDSGLN